MALERWLYTIPLRLRSLFRRARVEQELSEELQFHLEQRTERNVAAGMDRVAAQLEATRAMQGIEQSKEVCRDARGVSFFDNLQRDLRYAARMLRKSPGFTAVAVLSLALGIGANTAIFSLINTLLLRPLAVPRAHELRQIGLSGENLGGPQFALTYAMLQALEKQNTIFSGLFAWSDHEFQMRSAAEMVHVQGALASGDYFRTLGVNAALGRYFTVADDHSSGGKDGPVAVVSHRFWMEHYGGSGAAIGSALVLDGIRFTVIGVMPPEFFGAEVGAHPAIWVPLSFAPKVADAACMGSRSCWWLIVMGRVKSTLSARQIEAGMEAITPRVLREALPDDWPAKEQQEFMKRRFVALDGAQGWTFLRVVLTTPLAILMTLVGLVLLIACANLANLLLARASARSREIAVRLSLGAGRARVVRQLLSESVLLAFAGAAVGAVFAYLLTRVLVRFLNSQPGPMADIKLDIQPDWRVALFTVLVAGGSGLLFGLAPALRATRVGIAAALKESAYNLRSERPSRVARFLVPLQAAIAVLLVAAAGLFAGSLFHLLQTNAGFNPHQVFVISVDTSKRPERGAAHANLYSRMLERVSSIRGVRSASVLWSTPLTGMGWNQPVEIPGRKDLTAEQRMVWTNLIGPRFFNTMEIPLRAGRQFTWSDIANSEKVAIIDEVAARRFFPNRNPVGEQLKLDEKLLRIVGVAGHIKYSSLRDPDACELYLPYTQAGEAMPQFTLSFVVKTAPGVRTVYRDFRTALHAIAPDVPVGTPKAMQKQVEDSIARERLMATLSLFFGGLALLLTAIGLYGVLAYDVTRRTGEIGIRMALGARMSNVVWLIVRESTALIAIGILFGVAAAAALSKIVASLLYGIEPNDPLNLMAAVSILLLVAVTAAFLPALKAARLDPTVSLRHE